MRAWVLALGLVACKSDRPGAPPAPDAATDVAVKFAWPADASARVFQRVTIPSGTSGERTFVLDASPGSAPGSVAIAISAIDGDVLPSAQWLLAWAKDGLRFEVAADGDFAGTSALDDLRARVDDMLARGAPHVSEEQLAQLRVATTLITTDPDLARNLPNHIADLWIPWVWLWAEAGTLPAPGKVRTVHAFDLAFTVRTLGAGTTPGSLRVEAVTDRRATTEADLMGNRSWFVPSGKPVLDLDAVYHLVVTAEVDPSTLLPHAVSLDVRDDHLKWSYSYRFDWV